MKNKEIDDNITNKQSYDKGPREPSKNNELDGKTIYIKELKSRCKFLKKDNDLYRERVHELHNRINNLEGNKSNLKNNIVNLKNKLELLTEKNIRLKKSTAQKKNLDKYEHFIEFTNEVEDTHVSSSINRMLGTICKNHTIALKIDYAAFYDLYIIGFSDPIHNNFLDYSLHTPPNCEFNSIQIEAIIALALFKYLMSNFNIKTMCRDGVIDLINEFNSDEFMLDMVFRSVYALYSV